METLKKTLLNPEFWAKALVRAVKTIAQTMAASMVAGSVGIMQFDWMTCFSLALMSGVASMVTSIATGLPEVQMDSDIK